MGNDNKEIARAALVEMATALLQGPLQADEVLMSAPVDTYLTGILWPRGTPIGAEADDDDATGDVKGGDGSTASNNEQGIPGYRAIRPCSIGMTLSVKQGAPVEISLGQTARYVPVEIGAEPEPKDGVEPSSATGRAPRGWARKVLGYSALIPADQAPGDRTLNEFLDSSGNTVRDVRLSLRMRLRHVNGQSVFTFTLVNEEKGNHDVLRDAGCLFQAGLVVRAVDGELGGIQPRRAAQVEEGDEDALCNALLYRDTHEYAVGHGIATVWDEQPEQLVKEVRTAWLPAARVRGTSPDGHAILKDFVANQHGGLTAAFLGQEHERAVVTHALTSFVSSYAQWIGSLLVPRLTDFKGSLAKAAAFNLERCQSAHRRMRDGVTLLQQDDSAWLAFVLANQAMDRQSRYASKGDQARPLVWRPFQLAFMLLVLPSLVNPEREDRTCMDLLWFPTGGGKTEAYLALTAFQIFHRRLASPVARSQGGVDVLMRYTLRLLTVQQFQRAAALITACEFMRQHDGRLGNARISLGLYVGDDSTPNGMEKAREVLEEERLGRKPVSTPRQLLRCPVCGGDLHASAFRPHPSEPRIDIVCEAEGCEAQGNPLPILTVDDTIFASPPSLLIGTIDKFAQIPRSARMRPLFGLDGGEPPGLIIQDELHLISGPLGSMAGLYETAIDMLCTRGDVRPKVIGSTATIGQAATQVRALFDRSVLQFPPPGFDADDSFFAVRDTVGADRLYIGLPTAGRSPKFALQALVAALLQSAHTLVERGKADQQAIDAYWTCVAYFNSLRELGGAHVLMQDDVPRQMAFLAARLGASIRSLESQPVELSSRKSSRELPGVLQALSATLYDFHEALARGDIKDQPEDTVLASNMISVGVDISRLGLMVVNGQPKSTAEYIQASSRVGRNGPGLVFTLYNFSRPRDLSHFEHFRSYHSALYRSVEATSVTPWAPRARDKALHAIVISLVRHLVPGMESDEDALRFDADAPEVQALLDHILTRASDATGGIEEDDTLAGLQAIIDRWESQVENVKAAGGRLRYWKKAAPFGRTSPHLMCSAEESTGGAGQAWPTPGSMREVEPSSAFVLKTIPRRTGDQ
ncbi:helicase-related protein [Pseudomonas aeruginosa]|uniref:helicase-related protein n=1 Tax=Pseudomonas aeruginosa TaxID=287 RepID=UPI0003FDDEF7|nr:helicase-related protein [Pseudomonas aeruginosa]EKX5129221.1 DNA/RNA helicase [Pseudomonas aeruginosa]EMC2594288.1 DNA/RNA helicase [Pseudomonas aeruginosa]KAB0695539.1 helicase [Pseudomonas aeruginosa]MBI8438524.1 DNA/RNA helicase [Pseudomonas aeruginosa]MBI8906827.1 DNA/RNA helicase [Pseudomonas aeruginosa]